MSHEWIECSSNAPPPASARSDRQLECPATTPPVGQNWSSRSVYAIGAPDLARSRPSRATGGSADGTATGTRPAPGCRRRARCCTMSQHDVERGRERLLGEARLARGRDRGDVVAVEAGRRDVHDRVDVGVVDHRVPVGAGVLDRRRGSARPARRPSGSGSAAASTRTRPSSVRKRSAAACACAIEPHPTSPSRSGSRHGVREPRKLGAASDSPCSASIGSRRSP